MDLFGCVFRRPFFKTTPISQRTKIKLVNSFRNVILMFFDNRLFNKNSMIFLFKKNTFHSAFLYRVVFANFKRGAIFKKQKPDRPNITQS
jgi:hypothetical protein